MIYRDDRAHRFWTAVLAGVLVVVAIGLVSYFVGVMWGLSVAVMERF